MGATSKFFIHGSLLYAPTSVNGPNLQAVGQIKKSRLDRIYIHKTPTTQRAFSQYYHINHVNCHRQEELKQNALVVTSSLPETIHAIVVKNIFGMS